MTPAVVIFGPTGGGKSALAMALARALGGEVINADSRQIYKGMPIITACPAAAEYAAVLHHLFEFIDVNERYSAGRYAREAAEKIAGVRGRGKVPIVVGGTGFYLKALMQSDAAGAPPVAPAVQSDLQMALKSVGLAALVAELKKADPEAAAAMDLANPQRVVRALGVVRGTGRKFSSFRGQGSGDRVQAGFLCLALNPPTEELNARLERRWRAMLVAGAVEEVRRAWEQYPHDAPGLQAVGVPEIGAYLDGRMTLAGAGEAYLARVRQYAKRQRTWLRTQYPADMVFEQPEDIEGMMRAVRQRLGL